MIKIEYKDILPQAYFDNSLTCLLYTSSLIRKFTIVKVMHLMVRKYIKKVKVGH